MFCLEAYSNVSRKGSGGSGSSGILYVSKSVAAYFIIVY